MKKFKILSLILAVLILASSFSVLTVLANTPQFAGDDFENLENSLKNWNGLDAADIAEDASGNKYYYKNGKGNKITLNDSVWNGETAVEVSFVADSHAKSNATTPGGLKFYPLMSANGEAYINIASYYASGYKGVGLYNGPVTLIDVDGDGDSDKDDNAHVLELEESTGSKATPYQATLSQRGWWAYSDAETRYEKLRFTITYNWSEWQTENKIVITATVTNYDGSAISLKNNNPTTTLTYVYHGDAAQKPQNFSIGFENLNGTTYLDEITVKTATVAAQEFKEEYADVLMLDSAKQEDEDNIYAAYSAFNQLDVSVRTKLTAEKQKLEDLIEGFETAYIESFYGDNFENANYSSIFWDKNIKDIVKADGENKYISLTGKSEKYSILDKFIDNKTVTGISFVADSDGNTNASRIEGLKFYPLMSSNGEAYINIASYNKTKVGVSIFNGPVTLTDVDGDGDLDEDDTANILELEEAEGVAFGPDYIGDGSAGNIQRRGWWTYANDTTSGGVRYEKLRYTVWYDWSKWDTENTIVLTVSVTNYDGSPVTLQTNHKATVVLSYVYHGDAASKPEKFTIGFENMSGNTYLDEIKVFTNATLVKEFKEKYAYLLNRELSEITKADATAVSEAIREYNALNEESKAMISDEKTFLDLANTKVRNLIGAFTGDDFEDAQISESNWNNYNNMEIVSKDDSNRLKITSQNYLFTPKIMGEDTLPGKINFDIFSNYKQGVKGQTMSFYPIYNPETKQGIRVAFMQIDGMLQIRSFLTSAWKMVSGSKLVDNGTNLSATTYKVDTLINFTADISYEKWEKFRVVTIEFTFIGQVDGETKTITTTAEYEMIDKSQNIYNTTMGFIGDGTNEHYVDNLVVTYDTNGLVTHDIFMDTYKNVLEIPKDTLNVIQKKIVKNALDKFGGFSYDELRHFTEEEMALLAAQADDKSAAAVLWENDYSELFTVLVENAVPEMKESVDSALSAYANFSNSDKIHLTARYLHLWELKDAISKYLPSRQEGDYTAFTEDFEKGNLDNWDLNIFDSKHYYHNFQVVDDELGKQGKVLLYNSNSTNIVVKKAYWPQKAKLTKLNFSIRTEEVNSFVPPMIYFNWVDEENYIGLQIFETYAQLYYSMGGTVGKAAKVLLYNNQKLLLNEWTDVEISVDKNSVVTYNIISSNEVSLTGSYTLSGVNGGRLAIGHPSGHTGTFKVNPNVYVDDIVAEFEKGDWDDNLDIQEIKTYFDGNVWMEPGDIVTLSGENIGNTVSAVQMVRVPDEDECPQKVSYLGETKYNSLRGTENSKYMLASTLDGYWDKDAAIEATVMQKTTDSLKFKIPEEWENGIYAVKLISKFYKGDVILYINAPDTTFSTGNDGEIASRGGYVRLIGTGVAGEGKSKEDMKIALVSDAQTYFLDVTKIYENDVYSIESTIPDYVEYGEYEVFAYNGYGDSSCWSNPQKITVGPAIRDSWSTQIFDVTSFGAKADVVNSDDTAAIMSAITAAYENGGGIVYFPKGVYRVTATLTVPEKVRLKGEGMGLSGLLFVSADYNPLALPRTWISLAENTEISDLAFYGYRVRGLFLFNGDMDGSGYIENVYIHNIRTQVYNEIDGEMTGAGYNKDLLGWDEFRAMMKKELSPNGQEWMIKACNNSYENYNAKNIQIYDTEHDSDDFANSLIQIMADHIKIQRNNWLDSGYIGSCGLSFIFEDNQISNSCKGEMRNSYFARNKLYDISTNNRELLTTDGSPKMRRIPIQFLGDNEEKLNEVRPQLREYLKLKIKDLPEIQPGEKKHKYEKRLNRWLDRIIDGMKDTLFYYAKDCRDDMYSDMEVYVATGQGKGQSRHLIGNTKNVWIFDEPFEVAPNRNSGVNLHHRRCGVFIINNEFENGAACGCYGTIVDWVFDGNTFKEHYGQLFNAIDSIIWYTSVVNEKVTEPNYIHITGDYDVKADQTGARPGLILFLQTNVDNTVRCVLVRDNKYYDGSYINMRAGDMNSVRDVVFQDNFVEKASVAALNSLTNNVTGYEGVIIYENEFDNCENPIDDVILGMVASDKNINKIGDKRIIITNDYNPTGQEVFGDVNLDGRCSIKDSSVIKLYLNGSMVIENEEEKAAFEARADINRDGKVSLKDANLIKRYLLEGYSSIANAIK